MNDKTHMSVRVPRQLLKDLKIIAIKKDTNVTNLVSELLQDYVDNLKK